MKHQATVLRVNRNAAGVRFPFDRIYFFKKEAREHLAKIFSCALVIVPSKPFIALLSDTIKTYSCEVGKVYPMKRRDEEQSLHKMESELPIHDVVVNYENYLGLVPILYLQKVSRQKKADPEKTMPAYLRAKLKPPPGHSWRQSVSRRTSSAGLSTGERAMANMRNMFQDTFNAQSYFLMNGEEYQPICTVCSNSLAMVTGQCHLGEERCFEKLSQVNQSNYRLNMDNYLSWLKNVGEPELQLETENE